MFRYVEALVKTILKHPRELAWTTQGFGMIRCYPDGDEIRLNIWHKAFQVPGVSTIHDHPWDLESLCVAGRLVNQRYKIGIPGIKHKHVLLKPGQAVLLSEINDVWLDASRRPEIYWPGETYRQTASEIHETKYLDGTVTINSRTNRGPDIANVYWREGPWGSAKPRPATDEEITFATNTALALMEKP